MNQTTRTILIVTGVVVAGAVLLLGGMYIGRASWGLAGFGPGSMMGGNLVSASPGLAGSQFNYQVGPGMIGAIGQDGQANPYFGYGMLGQGLMGSGMMSTGMMGAYRQGNPDNPNYGSGMMGQGMMGGWGSSGLFATTPLSLPDAREAVQDYLNGLGNADLAVGEIMIFDNHAYAQIVEASTGIGALEVLVDPVTKAVTPEHGPNMMWNLKYSPMSGAGMMGMMSGFGQDFRGMMGNVTGINPSEDLSADLPVSPDQAVSAAQDYLEAYLPGTQADDHADPFYGYYTLHILRDGEVVGMLSVNGFTRQVFPHTWHGDFVEMAEGNHD